LAYALVLMARFGQQHRDRARREAKAQLEASAGVSFVRPESGCEETTDTVELEDIDFRLKQRLVTHERKLVEYAIVLTRHQGGQWVELYSVDTKHGTLHEHIAGHARDDDKREIQPLYTQVDVQESLDSAVQLVLEKYRKMRS